MMICATNSSCTELYCLSNDLHNLKLYKCFPVRVDRPSYFSNIIIACTCNTLFLFCLLENALLVPAILLPDIQNSVTQEEKVKDVINYGSTSKYQGIHGNMSATTHSWTKLRSLHSNVGMNLASENGLIQDLIKGLEVWIIIIS